MTIRLAKYTYLAYANTMFTTVRTLLSGMVSVLAFTTPPLYRHPSRASHEALQGDLKRVSADIERALGLYDE